MTYNIINKIKLFIIALALIAPSSEIFAADKSLGSSKDYFMHSYIENNGKVCNAYTFAIKSSNVKRSKKPSLNITNRDNDKIKNRIAIDLGVMIDKNKRAIATIDKKTYHMLVYNTYLFPFDEDEKTMLNSLKKGAKLVVIATTLSNVRLRDTYSLSGISKAIETIDANCSRK